MANDKWTIDFKGTLDAELDPAGLEKGEVPTEIQQEINRRVRAEVLATLRDHKLLTASHVTRLAAHALSAGDEPNPVKPSKDR